MFSLRDLQQVVLVATGVLAVLDLFLSPFQDCSVCLSVGWVREAGVTAPKWGPTGLQRSRNRFRTHLSLSSDSFVCGAQRRHLHNRFTS